MERPSVDCVHEWEQGLGRDSNIYCRKCMRHPGPMIHAIRERDQLAHRVQVAEAEAARLGALINAPETVDFAAAVVRESAHQRERRGSEHDGVKAPADWFWLVGYLAGKALHAQAEGRLDKALHHCISAAAALANWHASVLGETNMRPGIAPPPTLDSTSQEPE